jgi:hypothetical protein
VYPPGNYITAVGTGHDRTEAERNALAALVAIFGQSVQAEMSTLVTYSKAVADGTVNMSEDRSIQNAIKTSAAMDTLVGAEIAGVWFDGTSLHYAIALMDRQKTTALYTDMLNGNLQVIAELTVMPDAEKYTPGSIERFRLAGTIADVNQVYANVLTVLGNCTITAGNLRTGDSYRLEAADITATILIAVRVNDDRNSRINVAFARVLNKAGFKSGETASRFVLTVTLTLTEDPAQNQRFSFVNYLVDARLTDTLEGAVLLPFTITGKEGHVNREGAENRALMAAEKQIAETFGAAFTGWLFNMSVTVDSSTE